MPSKDSKEAPKDTSKTIKHAFAKMRSIKEDKAKQETLVFNFVQIDTEDSQTIEPQTINTFAWTERLSHYLAYESLKRHTTEETQVPSEQGAFSPYVAEKHISPDKGLVFEVLIPVHVTPDEPVVVYLTFTGTHSKETFLADWERAPGEECFRKSEQYLIWKHLNDAIGALSQKVSRKIDLVFIGHSLGGVFAQLAFHSVQRAIMMNQQEVSPDHEWLQAEIDFREALKSHYLDVYQEFSYNLRKHISLEHIRSLTLGAWNSAGVVVPVEENSLVLAKKLTALGVSQRAFYGLIEGDLFQILGQATVLNEVPPEDAELHVVKFNRREDWVHKKTSHKLSSASTSANLGGLGFLALWYMNFREIFDIHSVPTINTEQIQESVEIKFEYYQNNTEAGRAASRRVFRRTWLWNSYLMQQGRKVVYACIHLWVKHSDRKNQSK